MDNLSLSERSKPFLRYLESWQSGLQRPKLSDVLVHPEKTAILSVDMVKGFCTIGPLSGPRVNALVPGICRLFTSAWEQGVRQIILTQDTHDPDALEFEAFAPHCIRGTEESETIDEFKQLPFFDRMVIFEKNSISSNINTGLNAWIESHPDVDTWILVGDCTDICVYQSALFLKLQANEMHTHRRVIVPQDCVNTYDLPVETAKALKILPHDGDLLHTVFLYHMALNGIEVVQGFEM